LAALFNAVFLLVSVGAIGWEAVTRLIQPESVIGKTVIERCLALELEIHRSLLH
jgi:Co/Zn/Cd efflux system component